MSFLCLVQSCIKWSSLTTLTINFIYKFHLHWYVINCTGDKNLTVISWPKWYASWVSNLNKYLIGHCCVLSQFKELPQATFLFCVLPLDGAHSFWKSETSFKELVSYATQTKAIWKTREISLCHIKSHRTSWQRYLWMILYFQGISDFII